MANKLNVIIDTNVFVSAFITNDTLSPTIKILDLFYDDKIHLYYSDDIISEYKDVLSRKEFNLNKKLIGTFINDIKKLGIKINPESLEEVTTDTKDQPFYELVMSKKVNDSKLITGNIKHFPIKPFIMTPKEFIDKFYK